MFEWITTYNDLLNLIANYAMVLIWIVYLQIFLRNFRRQTLSKIVINRAAGSSLDAACFISNMSSEPIYVEAVLVELKCGDERSVATVTDFESDEGGSDTSDPKLRTYQGTLAPSQYSSLGSFDHLISSVLRRTAHNTDAIKDASHPIFVQITILADYASENLLIGATRKFRATWKGGYWKLAAETPGTEQIRSTHERKRLYSLIAAHE